MVQRLAVFRADAGAAGGTGHVRRCLAIAVALRSDGWRVGFATRRDTQALIPELTHAVEEVGWLEDCDEVVQMQARWPNGCDLLVVDHYGRDESFEAAARAWARRIVAIEDFPGRRHDCDMLVDSAPGRTAAMYHSDIPAHAVLLLGPAYAPLHPAFAAARGASLDRRKADEPVRRVLVNFGGGDTNAYVAKALAALARAEFDGTVDIVIGVTGSLQEAQPSRGLFRYNLLTGVKPSDLAERMLDADVALGAAGSSAWERCCLGLPSLVLVIADNQRDIAASLAATHAARVLGAIEAVSLDRLAEEVRMLLEDATWRRSLSTNAAALCDGYGAIRVAKAAAEMCAAA